MQQTENDERWYVQFDSGEVRLMTLEELDGAFEAGEVHENTFVIQVGETKWQTLADVAGLNDEESEEPEAPEAEPETTTLYTPHQAAALHASAHRQPAAAPYAAPQQPTAQRPPVQQPVAQQYAGQQHAPAQQRPAASPSVRPAVAAAAGGWPPVAAPAAQQSTWPPAAMSAPGGGYNIGPQSTIPVVNDLGLDFDARSFKSGRKTALLAVFAVIPALAGGGYMLTRLDMPGEATAAAAPAASPPPAPKSSPWSGSLGASMPTPAATPPAEAKTESAASGSLSDDMKKALLASDSSRTPKSKAKAAAPARRASGNSGSSKGSSVFKAGGSTNDPLNSKL